METPEVEARLKQMKDLRDGFKADLDDLAKGTKVIIPPPSLTADQLKKLMEDQVETLTNTLNKYGRD